LALAFCKRCGHEVETVSDFSFENLGRGYEVRVETCPDCGAKLGREKWTRIDRLRRQRW
jgi:NMD protein affecting ribosome stability and mRNA decay